MIDNNELQITKESYIKKDFYQIYPEILDLVSKISERWDPQSSNESDPGVVLLKLLAFIADKNNYNIDKNILEAFMPTASQESSMRKLCDMMGYNMKYYQSATVDVSFMYQGDFKDSQGQEVSSFKLKAFDTILTNEDGDVSYVLLKDVVFDTRYKTVSAEAMEGTLCEAVAGSSNIITLANIDDNNRFYLPETMVAENGIFVKNVNEETEWKKVDNMNFYTIGNQVYKFGFDSNKGLPYIEFPNDINVLIGEGLNIKYIRTQGVNGNVSAGTLTKFKSYTTINPSNMPLGDDESGNQVMVISNLSSSTNGRNKETLDEAYDGFKKTVGTYDTLVTCRDYANKIYQLVNQDDKTTPLVSNVQAADIRDDLNMSHGIMTFDSNGPNKTMVVRADNDKYDLIVYPFRTIVGAYTKNSYNNSFKPELTNINDIQANINNYKTISHNIKLIDKDNDVYCIKNKYNITAQITTTYKVNAIEQAEILNNVYIALFKTFNMREVDFGEPISYDAVYECIKSADTRIRNVSLRDLDDIKTYVLVKSADEFELFNNLADNYYIDYIAKNVLAGKVALYDYNTDFNFRFGQKANSSFDVVSPAIDHISTIANVPYVTSSETPAITTLNSNEVVQFRAPNFRTYVTYPAYVKYWMHFADSRTLEPDTEYALQNGDYLCINYTDTNNNTQYIKYTYDRIEYYSPTGVIIKTETKDKNIIKPNFELKNYEGSATLLMVLNPNPFGNILGGTNQDSMLGLDVSSQIEMRDYVKTRLGKGTNCYWIVADSLDEEGNPIGRIPFKISSNLTTYEYTLQEGEYFFYSNDAKTELVTLGSGTKLKTNVPSADSSDLFVISYDGNTIDRDSLMDEGLAAFSDINFKYIPFTYDSDNDDGTYIDLQEMQIITLTEKDQILQINPTTTPATQTLNNDWLPIDSAVYVFIEEGQSQTLTTLSTGDTWEVRSRYDLNVGPNSNQNIPARDSIRVYPISVASGSPSYIDYSNVTINTNYILQKAGSESITTRLLKYSDVDNEATIIDDFKVFVYDDVGTHIDADTFELPINYRQLLPIDLDDFDDIDTSVIVPDSNEAKFMVYLDSTSSGAVTIKSTDEGTQVNTLTNTRSSSPDMPVSSISLETGINIITVKQSCDLTFTKTPSAEGIMTLGGISVIKGINPMFKLSSSTALLAKIKTLATVNDENIFYYNYPIENDNVIDTFDMTDPFALYDYNNIYNKFTIAQLDTNPDNSKKIFPNITIIAGSKL